ncbi:uncharacterized protein LOC118462861 [Anopheles albimanus]|uniref:uncharacterized protein LOC118462861 n=1 Tax=Anopheles albimanus TaxID=7167 RepID=UPI00163EB630|nr:uncharacterized protein LOC118462861 [Anopheles albimanus]
MKCRRSDRARTSPLTRVPRVFGFSSCARDIDATEPLFGRPRADRRPQFGGHRRRRDQTKKKRDPSEGSEEMGHRQRRHGAVPVISPVAVLVVAAVLVVSHPDRVAADLMADIQQGLQTTGKLFGINTIADVADLVAKGFATRRGSSSSSSSSSAGPAEPTRTGEDGGAGGAGIGSGLSAQTPSMMVAMLKLLGLDGGQLGAMLVNSIIFLAHVIGSNLGAFRQPVMSPLNPSIQQAPGAAAPSSSFLAREPPSASAYDGPPSRHPPSVGATGSTTGPDSNSSSPTTAGGFNPLEWILRNPSRRFRVLLEQVQGTDLTEHLERELEHLNQYGPADTDCIRLLMCKIKPFIRKMQHVVRDRVAPPTGTTDDDQRQQQSSSSSSSSTTSGPPSGEEILDGIYHNLPTADEFVQQSEHCDQQFRHCSRERRNQ